MMISVIITAYKTSAFIEACLDSIFAQSLLPDKIFLGIDGCFETLSKVLKIKDKYNEKLNIVFYPKNQGTYVTKNTLIQLVDESSTIIFFDSDDIAHKNMIARMVENTPCFATYKGVMCLYKSTFKDIGGFMPWKCAADAEILQRIYKLNIGFKMIDPLCDLGSHEYQLTKSKDTGMTSSLRLKYHKYIDENRMNNNLYISPVLHDIPGIRYI